MEAAAIHGHPLIHFRNCGNTGSDRGMATTLLADGGNIVCCWQPERKEEGGNEQGKSMFRNKGVGEAS